MFSEVCRPYGDYIVWLQIIDHAKSLSLPVIFITGDTKDDWWASFQGKTLGPHPQLVQEFLLMVGKEFYMYPPDRFLERVSEYLKQDASEQAVNEIRDMREEDSEVALFDRSMNFAWPFGRPEYSQVRDSRWYSEKRTEIQVRGQQVRHRLNDMLNERKNLDELVEGLVLMGVKPDDEGFANSTGRIKMLNEMIGALEEELSAMRAQMGSLIAYQKALLVESGDGKV